MEETHRDSEVTLREITAETVRAVCGLEVGENQKGFVAPNALSIAQAHFEPHAWFRAVYAGEIPVGFVMLYDDPTQGTYYLWRFMIAAAYQRRGYGRESLEKVIEYVKSRPNAVELKTSFVPGEGSPSDFYRRLGFEETGEVEGVERVMRLPLK